MSRLARPLEKIRASWIEPTRPTYSNGWPTDHLLGPIAAPAAATLARNDRGAPGLWAYGISGDLPIVMVRIDEAEDLNIVRQLLRAHEYWRLKLLDVDLVILSEQGATYAQDLHDSLETLVRTSQSTLFPGGPSRPRRRPHSAWRPALARGPHAPPGSSPGRASEPPGSLADQSYAWSVRRGSASPAPRPGSRQTVNEAARGVRVGVLHGLVALPMAGVSTSSSLARHNPRRRPG